jgi:hypothetical protein
VSTCDRNFGDADEKSEREDHAAGPGEPKAVTERSPIASECRHT